MNRRHRELLSRMRRAYDLEQARNHEEAVAEYRRVDEAAKAHGCDSAYLQWCLAICLDNAGELEMAFQHIQHAVRRDPLAGPILNSFDAIAGRIRAVLADENRAPDDESTPHLYELLARAGEADVDSHLAMVRYHVATGKVGAAKVLVDAVTRLWPASPEAWSTKAAVARAADDDDTAREAELEASVLRTADVPFTTPGTAQA